MFYTRLNITMDPFEMLTKETQAYILASALVNCEKKKFYMACLEEKDNMPLDLKKIEVERRRCGNAPSHKTPTMN